MGLTPAAGFSRNEPTTISVAESDIFSLVLAKIAKELGIYDSALGRWANNKNDIKSEDLAKIAKYFGVSADYLIGLRDYP